MPRELPDGTYITIEGIVKARKGEDFFYYPEKLPVEVVDLDFDEFLRCYDFYHKFTIFGLPHGKGWMDETPDCIHILTLFDGWRKQTEEWIARK